MAYVAVTHYFKGPTAADILIFFFYVYNIKLLASSLLNIPVSSLHTVWCDS